MRGCLRFLAVITAVLFAITAVFALILTNLIAVVANRDLLKESLSDLDSLLVEAVPAIVAQTLEEQARERGLAPIDLDEAVLQESMETLLPPGWIDTQTNTAVDTIYDLLEGGNLENAELEIDTRPLLDRFRGQPGLEIVNNVVNSLPACTEPVNPAELLGPDVTIPACLPPDVPSQQISQEVHTRLVQAIDNNPRLTSEFGMIRVPIFSPEQQAQNEELVQTREQIVRLQQGFALAQEWNWLFWLLPIGCLFLIALLAVRSWSEWGLWWGWPLVGTAVFVLLLTLIFPTITRYLLRQASSDYSLLEVTVRQTGMRLVTAVTDTWQNRVNWQATVMLLTGILFLLFGIFTPKNRSNLSD